MKIQKKAKHKLFAVVMLLALGLTVVIQTDLQAQDEIESPCVLEHSQNLLTGYEQAASVDELCVQCKTGDATPIMDGVGTTIGVRYQVSVDYLTFTVHNCRLAANPSKTCRATTIAGGVSNLGEDSCLPSFDVYFNTGTGAGTGGTGGN